MPETTIRIVAIETVVWCRRGDVCPEATPCETLFCRFKGEKRLGTDDELRLCRSFQLTTHSCAWEHACHLDNGIISDVEWSN